MNPLKRLSFDVPMFSLLETKVGVIMICLAIAWYAGEYICLIIINSSSLDFLHSCLARKILFSKLLYYVHFNFSKNMCILEYAIVGSNMWAPIDPDRVQVTHRANFLFMSHRFTSWNIDKTLINWWSTWIWVISSK